MVVNFAIQFISPERSESRDEVVYQGNICKLGVTFASPVGHLRRTLGSRYTLAFIKLSLHAMLPLTERSPNCLLSNCGYVVRLNYIIIEQSIV